MRLLEIFVFGTLGLGLEVIFTAALDSAKKRDKHLMGYSSLWYFPIYALTPVYLHFTHARIFTWPVWQRGLFYTASFLVFEYISMGILRLLLGKSPSEESYRQSRWSIHGLTRLDFTPAHCLLGFLFEWIFRALRGI